MIITAEALHRAPADAAEELPYRARCTIAGITLELRTDCAALIERFSEYYLDQGIDASPAFAFSVATTLTGYRFACENGGFEWTSGPLPSEALMFLVDAAAISSLIDSDATLESFHAAAISWNGRAAAISGDSYAGKTTTLLACARNGAAVYTDERVILKHSIVQPFLRSCSIRTDSRRLLLAERGDDRLAIEVRLGGRLSLRNAFGRDAIAAPLPLSHVFVIARHAATASLRPISAAEALPGVSRWYRAPGNGFVRLTAAMTLLKSVRCYELTLGTPGDTARAILSCMESQ